MKRTSQRRIPIRLSSPSDGYICRNVDLEKLSGVVLEDHLLVGRTQPVEGFDEVPCLVQPTSRPWILHCADAWPLGSEEAPVRADRLEEQLERVLRIQHGVVVQPAHPVGEPLQSTAYGTRFEPGVLIRNRPAAMRDDDLERRE